MFKLIVVKQCILLSQIFYGSIFEGAKIFVGCKFLRIPIVKILFNFNYTNLMPEPCHKHAPKIGVEKICQQFKIQEICVTHEIALLSRTVYNIYCGSKFGDSWRPKT